jgi:hypothetical protein
VVPQQRDRGGSSTFKSSKPWKKFAGIFQGLEKAVVKLSKAWKNTVSAFPILGKLLLPQIIKRKL